MDIRWPKVGGPKDPWKENITFDIFLMTRHSVSQKFFVESSKKKTILENKGDFFFTDIQMIM
jgi:hypothetical protein